MSGGVVFLIGGTVILAASVYIFSPQWQLRQQRKRKPMPPLRRRIPGLPVDGEPLTGKETALLIQIRCGMHDTAPDPLEQSGDR